MGSFLPHGVARAVGAVAGVDAVDVREQVMLPRIMVAFHCVCMGSFTLFLAPSALWGDPRPGLLWLLVAACIVGHERMLALWESAAVDNS